MLEMHLHFVSTAASSRILVSQTEIFKTSQGQGGVWCLRWPGRRARAEEDGAVRDATPRGQADGSRTADS